MSVRRFVDFHTHTTFSDGSFTPEQIIQAADEAKLAAVAITDHDTLDAIPSAKIEALRFPELTFIPGVEISAHYTAGAMHILGLGVDEKNQKLINLLAEMRRAREERSPRIIEKLNLAGIDITLAEIYSYANVALPDSIARSASENNSLITENLPLRENPAGGVISRVHFAQVLINKGYAKNLKDAFGRYLGKGALAFVEKDQLKPADVIPVLKQASKIVALAHPGELRYNNFAHFEEILRTLVDAGLNGIECYHSSHTEVHTRKFVDFAQKYDLFITGGSDFHGLGKPAVQLGKPRTPASVVPRDLLNF